MFKYHSSYGNREWTDADNFQDLEEVYMNNFGSPQFMFLVTYQNHGGYNLNPEEMDTIHTTKDFGELTDDLNEYLTTVSSSADAFVELTDFFRTVDRPVIICMVGDHAPSLIIDLPCDHIMSTEEEEIAKRIVPLVIWSNYGLDLPEDLGYTWMPAVLPRVMNYAGIPLSTYYDYVIDINEQLPVILSNGHYVDREGNYGIYNEDSEYYHLLNTYYCMEYGMLNGKK